MSSDAEEARVSPLNCSFFYSPPKSTKDLHKKTINLRKMLLKIFSSYIYATKMPFSMETDINGINRCVKMCSKKFHCSVSGPVFCSYRWKETNINGIKML